MGRPKGSKNKPKVTVETKKEDKVDKLLKNDISDNLDYSSNEKATIETPSGRKTVKQIKDDLMKYEKLKESFATTKDLLQLINLTKTESRTFQTYSRETLRTYLQNPKAYESNLRNLSKYIYRLCYDYKRIIWHFATMICGDCFSVTPLVNLTEEINDEDLIDNYYETLIRWQRMDFVSELTKLLIVAWREDTVYGFIYDDSDQEGGTFFVHILDGDYCRISSIEDGVFRFAFDFSYFRNHVDQLEYYDKEFQKMYNKYLADSTLRWQELPLERQICFKVNSDDPTMDYPPFAGLLQRLISLIDLENLQNVKDELSAYKLLVARLKPLSGTDNPDDFEVDPKTAIKYYNKFIAELPDFINACISPLPIDVISFDDLNTTKDEDMISNSLNNVFRTVGGVILDNEKSGSTIYEAQIIADMKLAQATLLPQLNRWLNLYFKYIVGDNHAILKYIDGVCPYTKKAKRKELLESAQNGFSTVLEVGVLDGKLPLETISQLHLERALNLKGATGLMVPLSTSYTLSTKATAGGGGVAPVDGTDPIKGGAPEKDADELTDEGSASREGDKNK